MITITIPKDYVIKFLKEGDYLNEAAILENQKDDLYCRVSLGISKTTQHVYDKVGTEKNLTDILKIVCELLQVGVDEVKRPNRVQRISDCKKIFCYIAWKYTLASLKQIAGCVGNIDHTTVIHNRDRANTLMAKDFRGDLAMVEDFINCQYPKLRNIDKS